MEENIKFEEAMNSLEQIVQELEKGDLNLDESVSKFEEGMKISKKCNELLSSAEKKINVLINNEEGIVEEKFISEE